MNTSTSVIVGEASETDSDDESNTQCAITNASLVAKMTSSVQGAIITGEDSESDIDLNASIVSIDLGQENQSIEAVDVPEVSSPERMKKKYNSLLHRKLKENNISTYKNLNNFFSMVTSESTTSLNGTERQLMKSQLTLQAALNSLRSLNTNSIAIKNKLHDVIDANFLHSLILTKK